MLEMFLLFRGTALKDPFNWSENHLDIYKMGQYEQNINDALSPGHINI